MTAPSPITQLIVQGARARGLDPNAVLAVASMEGLGGGIGDGGTSFGPFQLHYGGAYPGSAPRGAAASQAWATSPQGINYALDQIAHVARGKRGRAAIEAIVSGFERPANPGREIAGALGHYGSPVQGGVEASYSPPNATGGMVSGPSSSRIAPALVALLSAGNQMFGLPALPQIGSAAAPPLVRRAPAVAPPSSPAAAGLSPVRTGKSLGYIEHFASPFGLTITSTTGGHHAEHSLHYAGRAADFSGDPAKMAALAKFALAHPRQFQEVIYSGPGNTGYAILGGRIVPLSQLGKSLYAEHENHVHLAR